jgi:hypothetical protein
VFVARAELVAPFFDGAPQPGQTQGLYLGNGDQDHFLAVLLDAATLGVQVHRETSGQASVAALGPIPGIADAQRVALMLIVEPSLPAARAMVSVDEGPVVALGEPIPLPAAWLSPSDSEGLAVGLMASATDAASFAAHWQSLEIVPLATDDHYTVSPASGPQTLPVQLNDAPAAGRRISALGAPDRGGTVTLDDAGTPTTPGDDRLRYTPGPAATVETMTYTVTTSFGWSDTAVIAVNGAAASPRVFADGFESAEELRP